VALCTEEQNVWLGNLPGDVLTKVLTWFSGKLANEELSNCADCRLDADKKSSKRKYAARCSHCMAWHHVSRNAFVPSRDQIGIHVGKFRSDYRQRWLTVTDTQAEAVEASYR
jgi:hypothetical protein